MSKTIEQLLDEYISLKNELSTKSKLDDDPRKRQSSSMGCGGTTTNFADVREHFQNRTGMKLSGKPYSELVKDLASGHYRNKSRPETFF